MNRHRWSHHAKAGLVGAAALLAVLNAAPAHAQGPNTQAFGASVALELLPPVGTVSLPPTPLANAGNPTDSLANISLPPVLTTGVTNVSVSENNTGTVIQSLADASVANVGLTTGILNIAATAISSTCSSTEVVGEMPTGDSTLAGLTVTGVLPVVIPVDPAPNTVINLQLVQGVTIATLTLNEQIQDPVNNTLTVNALHLELLGGVLGSLGTGDVILASTTCDAAIPVVPVSLVTGAGLGLGLGVMALAGGGYGVYRRATKKTVLA
jgi:hypothetical protein